MAADVIYIGSDHAGFLLKQEVSKFLAENGYNVEDLGPEKYDKDDDYPDYALKVCQKIVGNNGRGILICKSGQGMSIAANKVPGIHAAVCWNVKSTEELHDANVLCLGGGYIDANTAKRIVDLWIKKPPENADRHKRRLGKIDEIERYYKK